MGAINMGRVVAGGLLAGVIINVSETILNVPVIGAEMEAALRAMNLTPPGLSAIGGFVVLGFLLGIATVWLYAAIRPRFGAGPGTAVWAGLAVWFFAYFYPTAFFLVLNIFPRRMMIISLVWGLFEIVIAAVAGAWAYTEV